MKIRQGFVSNSSSSSFIAVGFHTDKNDLANQVFEKLEIPTGEYDGSFNSDDVGSDWYDLYTSRFDENGYGVYKTKEGLSFFCGEEGPFFIGLDLLPFIIKNKTLSESKKILKDILGAMGIKSSVKDLIIKLDSSGGR